MKNARPPAMFVAESRGLDFLNSIATPVDEAVEFIGSGEDFLQWLREAELVPAGFLPHCAIAPPPVNSTTLRLRRGR